MKEHCRQFVSARPNLWAIAGLLFICSTAAHAACPAGTACDPGPRPVGKQSAQFAGPVNIDGVALLPTPVVNTRQPPDAKGNEGAGQVIRQGGGATGFWFKTTASFGQVASVDGASDPDTGNPTIRGLGPAFNGNSCFACHSHPAIGGSSPGVGTPGFTENPQISVAKAFGAANPEDYSVFIKPTGPVREARLIINESDPSRRTLDGSVHSLFTIQGRTDAPAGCVVPQPDVATQLANNNVSFRIPTPTFGLGLIENVADADLIKNAGRERSLNVSIQNGVVNRSGNDGTVTRFGWKAQNKSLLLFSAEATNVEMGITNEIFPNERVAGTNCASNMLPEDETNTTFQAGKAPGDVDTFVSSAIENFAAFMRFNGAPAQCDFSSGVDSSGNAVCNPLGASAQNGLKVFEKLGCNVCHTESFTTQPSNVEGLSNRTFQPFSDFALHHMGATLADGITQGLAGADQFRTAPLWGLGQRLFFLHDGRTSDLKEAILDHASAASSCFTTAASQTFFVTFPLNNNATTFFSPASTAQSCGSEANGVIGQFKSLTASDEQDLLNFLRSL
jgi:cytochrome c peroxidase